MPEREEFKERLSSFKEDPKISADLAKMAEMKLKNINSAIKDFEKKHKIQFPYDRYEHNYGYAENLRGNPNQIEISRKIISVRMPQKDDDDNRHTDDFLFKIRDDRIYNCSDAWEFRYDNAGKEIGKPFKYKREDYQTKKILNEESAPQEICISVSKPENVVLFPSDNSDNKYEPKSITLSPEEKKKFASEIKKSKRRNVFENSRLWYRINKEIDNYQETIVNKANQRKQEIEQQKKYTEEYTKPKKLTL